MEQERVIAIILISTIIVLIFVIAMVVLFSVFRTHKNKLVIENNSLQHKINELLAKLDI